MPQDLFLLNLEGSKDFKNIKVIFAESGGGVSCTRTFTTAYLGVIGLFHGRFRQRITFKLQAGYTN